MKAVSRDPVTLFLCGDVMTGRGIDQVLPHSVHPRLHESFIRDARRYAELAEGTNGEIPRPVDFSYPWGDALAELRRRSPDARIVNLETALTASEDHWRWKGIHYRMHPKNVPLLEAAGVDACALANNHVLDWGRRGLLETLETLGSAEIASAGAGRDLREASAPALIEIEGKGRLVLTSFGFESSGIPEDWAASGSRGGVFRLPGMTQHDADTVAEKVRGVKRRGDIAIASIHWGENWGYQVPGEQVTFAHRLIDEAGVDIVHGHSSHHPKGIEVYRERPILYGSGDFLNDYEGIGGYEQFRSDMALMYFLEMDRSSGALRRLEMVPARISRFRLQRANEEESRWLAAVLNREGRRFRTGVEIGESSFLLRWEG